MASEFTFSLINFPTVDDLYSFPEYSDNSPKTKSGSGDPETS